MSTNAPENIRLLHQILSDHYRRIIGPSATGWNRFDVVLCKPMLLEQDSY